MMQAWPEETKIYRHAQTNVGTINIAHPTVHA